MNVRNGSLPDPPTISTERQLPIIGRTTPLDKKVKAPEQERRPLETKLATTKAGKLDNLPGVVGGNVKDYRAKVPAPGYGQPLG